MVGSVAILAPNMRVGTPGLVTIAAGTDFYCNVWDVRPFGPWATESVGAIRKEGHTIVYHHTASDVPWSPAWRAIRPWLDTGRRTWPWGVPYNFLVVPQAPHRIYYVHDVDRCWPHTQGYNCATAIAALGNYSTTPPPADMVARMLRLADALATMWDEWVPELQHRDITATECPGNLLSPLLPGHAHQRDGSTRTMDAPDLGGR